MRVAAIVLSGGDGRRMQNGTPKQYLSLLGRPMLYYSLKAFEESVVDEIVLVTKQGEEERCEREFVMRYGFSKVAAVVGGGRERYHSVFAGLQAVRPCNYVLIHDGARPLVTPELICRMVTEVQEYKACVAGVPVKDTIQVVDEDQNITLTPKRDRVWQAQTPQAFEYETVLDAYTRLMAEPEAEATDDAMAVGLYHAVPIHMLYGSHTNIKVTTPEDLAVAETFLLAKKKADC